MSSMNILNSSSLGFSGGSTNPTNQNDQSIEKILLYSVSSIGILLNCLTILFLLIIPAYRIKSSCFLFHHCLICLTLSSLLFPYAMSFSHYQIRCDYLGNIQVTCVTAQLLNMAAMVASEAYRFEDLIHQENSTKQLPNAESTIDSTRKSANDEFKQKSKDSSSRAVHHHYFEYQLKETNDQSTISCGCLSFGILIIWFSSVILHLGITMIGTESKSYYHESRRYCNFITRDTRGYVLTLMWIIITIFSLLITVRYIHKILREVSSKRRHHQPLLSLTILGQNHGQSIASRDVLMQQIEQRIQLNILLIVLFILFWFPLFFVSLINTKFDIDEHIPRYLLLLAWSNSSLSPMVYSILLPRCGSLCCKRNRSTTYDSLTSYYNRIGDRFHDIGKWDKYHLNERTNRSSSSSLPKSEGIQLHRLNKNKGASNKNSLIVKEIKSNNRTMSSSSSSSSVASISVVHERNEPVNGLLVTSNKRTHR